MTGEDPRRGPDRVARAPLDTLPGRLDAQTLERRLDLPAPVPHDGHQAPGLQAPGRLHHMADQGPPREVEHDLRAVASHPLAFAGSENDDGEV